MVATGHHDLATVGLYYLSDLFAIRSDYNVINQVCVPAPQENVNNHRKATDVHESLFGKSA